MKLIKLTQGNFAQVDDEDFELISKYKLHITGTTNKYARTHKHNNLKMHRLIMGCVKGDGKTIDHKDGNGLNNQKSNLRFCSRGQNTANRKKKKGHSLFLGVTFTTKICKYKNRIYEYNRWQVKLCCNNKTVLNRDFKTEKEAALAYNEAAKIHHGEFARLNLVE